MQKPILLVRNFGKLDRILPSNFLQFWAAIDVAKMESSTENVISILFVENQRKRIEREKLNFVTEIPLSNMFLLFRDRPTFGIVSRN